MKYQGKDHTNNLIAEFLKLPVLEQHPNGTVTYKLWASIVPYAGYEMYDDSPCLVFKDHSHVYNLLFHSDWNWLMHLAKEVRIRIIIPMDSDLNNWTNDQYQRLRGYFLAQLEAVDKTKLYVAIVEIIQWWIKYEDYNKRRESRTT